MEIVLILIVVVVASVVGTMTGFGLSTVMVPVIGVKLLIWPG